MTGEIGRVPPAPPSNRLPNRPEPVEKSGGRKSRKKDPKKQPPASPPSDTVEDVEGTEEEAATDHVDIRVAPVAARGSASTQNETPLAFCTAESAAWWHGARSRPPRHGTALAS